MAIAPTKPNTSGPPKSPTNDLTSAMLVRWEYYAANFLGFV